MSLFRIKSTNLSDFTKVKQITGARCAKHTKNKEPERALLRKKHPWTRIDAQSVLKIGKKDKKTEQINKYVNNVKITAEI